MLNIETDDTMSDTRSDPTPTRHVRRGRLALAVAAAAATGVVAAAALTGVAAAATGTSQAPGSASNHPPHVLHFAVDFSPFNVIDVPPLQQHRGDYRPGDYAVFSDVLRNARGRAVGTEAGSGLITKVSSTGAQVYFTMAVQIAGGQIAAQGISSTAPTKRLAVVGGTGQYTGASGLLELVENGDGTGRLTLILR
jgi:hypothetical protein